MTQIEIQDQETRLTNECGTFFGMTHQGHCRPCNEDRYLIKALKDGSVLLAVADGLGNGCAGGHAAGMIMEVLSTTEEIAENRELEDLQQMANALDCVVCEKESTDPKFEGMGSTLICVLIRNCRLYWVHAGDSRLYMLRNGKLTQITEDQTLARFLVAEGEISLEETSNHYSRNVMDQYLGCGYCEPETGRMTLEVGDMLLLSSDGLHDQISIDALHATLKAGDDAETTARALSKAALDAGGPDNITVIVADDAGRISSE